MNTSAIQKYLHSYAEIDAVQKAHEISNSRPWNLGVLIPAYSETFEDLTTCLHHLTNAAQMSQRRALAVVSFNAPTSSSEQARQITCETWQRFGFAPQQEMGLTNYSDSLDLLGINHFAFSPPHPKEGVGRERKWLADFLATLVTRELVTESLLFSTDADACVPRDYFERALSLSGSTGTSPALMTFPFRHEPRTSEILHYEEYLESYVAGLRFAQSPYAYHSLGSCLAFSVELYAQVRGFPKRAAGEDFYFLNKARKLTLSSEISIEHAGAPILLQSRLSTRTPFGTGPALERVKTEPSAYAPYPRELFRVLRATRGVLMERAPWAQPEDFSEDVAKALVTIGYFRSQEAWQSQSYTQGRIDEWLDAFRTLRFIHELQRDSDNREASKNSRKSKSPEGDCERSQSAIE